MNSERVDDVVETVALSDVEPDAPSESGDPYRPRFRVAPGAVRAAALIGWFSSLAVLVVAAFVANIPTRVVDLSAVVDTLPVTVTGYPDIVYLTVAAAVAVVAVATAAALYGVTRGSLAAHRVAFTLVVVAVPVMPLMVFVAALLLVPATRDWVL